MEKCRICLGNKKTLICVFDSNKNVSYADMIVSIANIKIVKRDGNTNKICRSCRKSLQEAYDFKLLIQRSDAALNKNTNQKTLYFNNLNDIKYEIEVEIDSKNSINKCMDIKENFKDGVDEICYSDTIIKKVGNIKTDDVYLKPVPVLEFLKTIKDEPDDDNFSIEDFNMNCSGVDSDDDGDYIPPYKLLDGANTKRKKRKKHAISKKCTDEPDDNDNPNNDSNEATSDFDGDYIPPRKLLNTSKIKRKRKAIQPGKKSKSVTQVCLKPVYLRDLKLVYSKSIVRPIQRQQKNKDSDTKLVCPHCGILTKSLKSHILQHSGERKFKCDECSKAFFAKSALRSHKKQVHAKTKDFKCDKCTAAFSNKQALKGHDRMHNPQKNFVCDICNKAFKRPHALKRHRIGHNSSNKTVMCDLCNMSFFNKFGLRHHMRIHTGERPYKCEICSQPYSYKHDFNRHCLKKHGVFFKRRSVFVMNEEVLAQERILMRDLMLRVHGVIKDEKPINPFEGPQAALAFEQTIKAIEAKQITVDFQF